jgi:hypothetical protein
MNIVPPSRIFIALEILGLTVESLNGVRNRSMAAGAMREADPDFGRMLALMRNVQAAGAVGMRVEEDKANNATAVLFFRRDDVSADITEKTAEIRRWLKLSANSQKYVLAYSPVRGGDNELAVNSRSCSSRFPKALLRQLLRCSMSPFRRRDQSVSPGRAIHGLPNSQIED